MFIFVTMHVENWVIVVNCDKYMIGVGKRCSLFALQMFRAGSGLLWVGYRLSTAGYQPG